MKEEMSKQMNNKGYFHVLEYDEANRDTAAKHALKNLFLIFLGVILLLFATSILFTAKESQRDAELLKKQYYEYRHSQAAFACARDYANPSYQYPCGFKNFVKQNWPFTEWLKKEIFLPLLHNKIAWFVLGGFLFLLYYFLFIHALKHPVSGRLLRAKNMALLKSALLVRKFYSFIKTLILSFFSKSFFFILFFLLSVAVLVMLIPHLVPPVYSGKLSIAIAEVVILLISFFLSRGKVWLHFIKGLCLPIIFGFFYFYASFLFRTLFYLAAHGSTNGYYFGSDYITPVFFFLRYSYFELFIYLIVFQLFKKYHFPVLRIGVAVLFFLFFVYMNISKHFFVDFYFFLVDIGVFSFKRI